MRVLKFKYNFSQSVASFQKYLNSKSTQLTLQTLILQQKNIKSYSVPRIKPNRQQITSIFQSNNLKDRNLIMHVNPVSLLGLKRLFYEYTQKHLHFKEMDHIDTKISMNNPDKQIGYEQLQFTSEHFFLMDKQLTFQFNKDLSQQQNENKLNESIQKLYAKQPNRYMERLKKQLKVETNYLDLIQISQQFQCNVYFSGFNQLRMRKLITIKQLLINCLKYTENNNNSEQNFPQIAREYIYEKYFKLIANFQAKTLKKLIKKLDNPVIFAPNYVIELLKADEAVRVKIPQQKGEDINQQRIQKHAILETILGDLWNQPYIINKFPYLTQDFTALSQEDKEQVINIYNVYIKKYKTVIKNYLTQRVNARSA